MMSDDNTIRADDLVMVSKPKQCCGATSNLGRIFTVAKVVTDYSVCGDCGHVNEVTELATENAAYGFQTAILSKIKPLPESVDVSECEVVEV